MKQYADSLMAEGAAAAEEAALEADGKAVDRIKVAKWSTSSNN